MRILKTHVLLRLLNSYIVDSPQPANISYLWNFGSLLGTCLVLQILTGVILAMHYTPSVEMAFNSVEHIMRDVSNGWIVRYTHANVASFFFIFVYFHIGRNLYYGSYKSPRILVWSIGVVLLIGMMLTAFLGYTYSPKWNLATVITNLLSAVPVFGQDLVELIWGGFSVNNATLNRFFSLHYLLPFVLAALAVAHLLALHTHGSNNPNGVGSNSDRYAMHPYFTFKDLVTIFFFFLVLSIIIFYFPNLLGHSDNWVIANPMQTPASIKYFDLLPFYAILRSIPSKAIGVIAMFGSLLILLILPYVDISRIRGNQFRPMMKVAFWFFVFNFMILLWIGAEHPNSPYVEIGQVATAFYFSWFLIIVPLLGLFENTLIDISLDNKNNKFNTPIQHQKKEPQLLVTIRSAKKNRRSYSTLSGSTNEEPIDPPSAIAGEIKVSDEDFFEWCFSLGIIGRSGRPAESTRPLTLIFWLFVLRSFAIFAFDPASPPSNKRVLFSFYTLRAAVVNNG
uniref:Cytochrome b n=1 Tax=Wolfiporia cocos TaxID=81056 RepID=A0A7G7YDX3_9APHY|nr:apocytochrome b [Wolfiporia cocos]